MKYITYYRVSTKQQGQSGLGMAAQRTQVQHHIKSKQGTEIDSYTEIESGRKNDRVQLRKAVDHAKRESAVLLVAVLDRLSRDAAFILALKSEMERAKTEFQICGMPGANTLTIGILAVVAQDEQEKIKNRTIAGLNEARKRGTKLGTPENLTLEARQKAHKAISDKAINDKASRHAFHFIKPLREQGISYRIIATQLNAEDYRTTGEKPYHAILVKRIYDRFTNVSKL